jgi:hypothetical protein
VRQDELPPADVAALREAVLGFYEESIGRLVEQQRRGRPPRRLHPLWLLVLLPWLLLVGLVRMALFRRQPQVEVRQQRAVSLYRQLSGKDPVVARAELGRIYQQLMAIDQRVKPSSAPTATAEATRRVELGAAAGALLAYHLGGRQTDDALLAEIQAAWAEYEVLGEQRLDQQRLGRVARGHRRRLRGSATSRGRRWTATLPAGVPGLIGTASRTARRTVAADQAVRWGGSNR